MDLGVQALHPSRWDTQFAIAHQAGQIAWYPWVGQTYPQAPYKVLVVLESHYINWERTNVTDLTSPYFTRRIVAEQLSPLRWPSKTFNNLTACLSGRNVSKEEPNWLWEKVALYNFVQRPMNTPAERPNAHDFIAGWKSFLPVADILRPDVCLFAGFSALSYLGNFPDSLHVTGTTPWEPQAIDGAYPRPCFTICTANQTFQGVTVKHPGKFFSAGKWRNVLQRQIPVVIDWLSQ